MSLYLASKGLDGPQCVTVLSHKGPWRDSLVWKFCPIRDTGGTPFCDNVCFSRFQVGFYGFQDSRLVFHGSRSVFHDSRSIFIVFQGSRLVFLGSRLVLSAFQDSRLVFHGSSWVFMVFQDSRFFFSWFHVFLNFCGWNSVSIQSELSAEALKTKSKHNVVAISITNNITSWKNDYFQIFYTNL